jgi:hypothetical protein
MALPPGLVINAPYHFGQVMRLNKIRPDAPKPMKEACQSELSFILLSILEGYIHFKGGRSEEAVCIPKKFSEIPCRFWAHPFTEGMTGYGWGSAKGPVPAWLQHPI